MSVRPAQNSSWKRRTTLLPFAALIVLSAAIPARAGIIITAQSVSSSDGALDVFLTNTGPSAVSIASFSFEVNVSSSQVTFTDATFNTTLNPYIFAGNSLFGPDILEFISNGGHTLDASDATSNALDVSVGSGESVGLGLVLFTTSGALSSDATVSFTGYPSTGLADAAGTNVPIDTLTNGTISSGTIIIPEPSTLILATIGLATSGATCFARRSRQKAAS
jgi:hypothetical protein